MMLITTSHRPTRRTRSFGHDLEKVLPNSLYLTRGKKTIQDFSWRPTTGTTRGS